MKFAELPSSRDGKLGAGSTEGLFQQGQDREVDEVGFV